MNNKDKKEITNFLSKNKLMSVGTYHRKPWAACVYYLFDDELNLFFVSDPKTKHCLNIRKNPKVSITIADTSQDPKGNKTGFQASGQAKIVTSVRELKEIIKAWNKRGFVPVTYETFKKAWKSKFYKINLDRMQLFDQNQPEETEVREWKL